MMNLKDLWEKIKDKVISLYSQLIDYCSENKKKAAIIGGLIVLILILLILLLSISPKNRKKIPYKEKKLILSEQLLVPKGPEVQEEYNVTRNPKEKWTDEEADEWFTEPSQKDIDSLGKTNDGIINEILGAAP